MPGTAYLIQTKKCYGQAVDVQRSRRLSKGKWTGLKMPYICLKTGGIDRNIIYSASFDGLVKSPDFKLQPHHVVSKKDSRIIWCG